jgi:PhnB protein
MELNPYLNFSGQCEAAFKFYEKCLGGTIQMMMRFGESPMANQVPAERRNQIMHMRMTAAGTVLMGADAPPEYYQKPQGFSVALNFTDPAEAERVFNALAEKGTVQMPLQQTFWAVRFGALVDQFGIPWMINCEQQSH